MRNIRRSIAPLLSLALLLAVLVTAAPFRRGLAVRGAVSTQSIATGGTLNQPLAAEPPSLNNLLRTDRQARLICDLYLTPPLLVLDPDSLLPTPALAAALPSISEDRLVHTWTLRPDARWEDGTPVTTRDVKLTYDLARAPESGAERLRTLLSTMKSLDVVDEQTFRVTYSEPYFRDVIEMGTNFALLPAHKLKDVAAKDLAAHPIGRQPLAYGPYRLQSWSAHQEIVLVRNDTYFGPKPYLDTIRYRIVKDRDANPRLLSQGVIDWGVLSPDDWERLFKDPEFEKRNQKFSYYLPETFLIGWNCRRPLFKDPRVRLAMSHSIRREEVVNRVLGGHGHPAVSALGFNDPGYPHDLKPPAFDLDAARKLLAEAGWKDSNGDGILDREGLKFEFELQQSSPQNPVFSALLTSLKSDLEKLGIVCGIQNVDWPVFTANLKSRQFDAFFFLWISSPADDDLGRLFHSSFAEGGQNYSGYSNPEVDKLLDQAHAEFDREKRVALFHRVQEILNEEQPMSFVHHPEVLLAVSRRFGGVKAHRLGMRPIEWYVND